MPYEWILLDADNTLFDFDTSERYALKSAIEKIGIPFEESHIERYHQINHSCWRAYEAGTMTKSKLRLYRFEQFFSEIGVKTDTAAFADSYMHQLGSTDFLVEGAIELLEDLQDKYHLTLVTNGLKEVQYPRLNNTGLQPFFKWVIVSDEIGHSKPAAEFFEHTFRSIDHPEKETVLMVGDNLNADIRGGNDYGLDTCWFNPGRKPNDSSVMPTYEIHTLQQLSVMLDPGSS